MCGRIHVTKDKNGLCREMLKHLACIMDGNRRWAMRQNLAKLLGHKKGIETITLVTDFCLAKKIRYLSLYAYSIENLHNRCQEEQHYLFGQLTQEALQNIDDFKRKGVRIQFIGDRTLFPKSIHLGIDQVEKETVHYDTLYLNLLLCYSGRHEIIDTAKRIAQQVAQGKIAIDEITPQLFENSLWTAGVPFPDLIIRTGGEHRLSNFLLYQAAYSELYFLDCLWPDISEQELEKALIYYDKCQKNFGK